MAAMTSSRILASFIWQVDETIAFSHGDEDCPLYFYLSPATWEDMGNPKTLTITVTPGDQLNG